MSLEKVLRLTQPAAPAPDASALVRAASDDLERLALLLAGADDGEGDDDEEEDEDSGDGSKGDEDDDDAPPKKGAKGKAAGNNWSKGGKNPAKGKGDDSAKGKKMPPWLNKGGKDSKSDKVKASRELVQSAMVALSQLTGGEHLVVALGHSPAPDPAQVVLRLARGGAADVAMEHGPMNGEHDHPHRVVQVHSHKHTHNGDSRHACGDPGYGGY